MAHHSPTPEGASTTSATSASAAPRLRGRWVILARIAWFAAVLGVLAFYAATLPSYFAYLRVVAPAGVADTAACGCPQLTAADAQTLHQLGLSMDAFAGYVIATRLLILLGFGAVGVILFWRAAADRVAFVASLTLILYSITFYAPPGGLLPGWPALPGESLAFLGAVCLGLFLCIFPSGRFVPRWAPWLLLAWIAYNAYDIFSASFPHAPLVRTPPDFAISACLGLSLVAVQVYRYRRVSTPVQRQQTKWVVLCTALGFGGYLAAFLVFVVISDKVFGFSFLTIWVGFSTGSLLTLLIPLGIGIAILRHRLFDVDLIIRRTLVYGVLSVILAAVYFGVVLGLQALVTAMTHQTHPQPVILVASTLLIAMLANPLRRRIQAAIDRRYYRARYDAARALHAFAATVRTETDLRALGEHLLAVVRETMQPASVSLWLRASGTTPRDERLTGGE